MTKPHIRLRDKPEDMAAFKRWCDSLPLAEFAYRRACRRNGRSGAKPTQILSDGYRHYAALSPWGLFVE
jgi:ferric-dicitrate binding protein FerR (iron transport regulator)